MLLVGYAIRIILPRCARWCTKRSTSGTPTACTSSRLCWSGFARVGARGPLGLGAGGFTAFTAGNVWYFQVVAHLDPEPFPSLSDAAWLTFYPCCYAAVVLLLRRRLLPFHASMWLDGLLSGFTVAGLGAVIVLPAVLQGTGGNLSVVTVNLAYPILDLLMVTLLIGVFAVFGWQPGRVWWLLALGLARFAAADTGYLFQIAADGYSIGGLVDLLWNLGVVLPGLLSLLSLGLLLYAGLRTAPAAAVVLAFAAVVTALVRTGLTFREVRALADARRQARTDELTGMPNRRSFLEQTHAALVYPDGFVPLAEQAGLMRLLTLSVLEKAVRQVAAWRQAGCCSASPSTCPSRTCRTRPRRPSYSCSWRRSTCPRTPCNWRSENVLMSDPTVPCKFCATCAAWGCACPWMTTAPATPYWSTCGPFPSRNSRSTGPSSPTWTPTPDPRRSSCPPSL